MKGKKKRFLIWIGLVCLILGLSAGCGHKQEKGERYEERTYEDESAGFRYEEPATGEEQSENRDENSKPGGSKKTENSSNSEKSGKHEEVSSLDVSEEVGEGTESEEYQGAADSAVESLDPVQEETKAQGNLDRAGTKLESEAVKENLETSQPETDEQDAAESNTAEPNAAESNTAEPDAPEPYYLTEADKGAVIAQLAALGESYGLTYYPDVTESETWDSPTPIYEEELVLGRDYLISTMVEYTEGAFVLMQMEGCRGFALSIRQQPDTVTDAYYEVYVYWM